MRVVFCFHAQTALLPVEIAQMFFRETTPWTRPVSISLWQWPVRLETVEEVGGGGEVVDACLFEAWRRELRHSKPDRG
jgi:hypothetical protein